MIVLVLKGIAVAFTVVIMVAMAVATTPDTMSEKAQDNWAVASFASILGLIASLAGIYILQ